VKSNSAKRMPHNRQSMGPTEDIMNIVHVTKKGGNEHSTKVSYL